MGTKNNPGPFDCYKAALPDEPVFVLLARDPRFYHHVNTWAKDRMDAIHCGDRPVNDGLMVSEAFKTADNGAIWRRMNNGIWRKS